MALHLRGFSLVGFWVILGEFWEACGINLMGRIFGGRLKLVMWFFDGCKVGESSCCFVLKGSRPLG